MEIDDARRLILKQYAEMVAEARDGFYGSQAQAIHMAAAELVSMRMLGPELAEGAVREAVDFAARGARSC